MKPKANSLFHFTKSLDVLMLILEGGFHPRYCLENFDWFSPQLDFIAFPMCCFCDIPISRISEHVNFYGEYGIGLTKEWGMYNKLNPVVYCPIDGKIRKFALYYHKLVSPESDPQKQNEHSRQFYRLLSLTKPIQGKMAIPGGVVENKEFFQENEWRFVPDVDEYINKEKYDLNKDDLNRGTVKFSLKFAPLDIRYIFLKEEGNIPLLVDFIHEKLGHFPLNDLKILQSRIVPIQTLKRDL